MTLSPSDRVRLICGIGKRLNGESWTIIDLTLRQFGLPTSDIYSGSGESYVIEMIDRADDNDLISLGTQLGVETEPVYSATVSLPAFWEPGHFRLFISHLADHREYAGDTQHALRSFGISSFVAHADIKPTKDWQEEIQSALASCDALLALMHPGFHNSEWTDQEIGYAMGRQVLIVTVDLGTAPYGFISKFQAITRSKSAPSTLSTELFGILARHPNTMKRMSEAAVRLFSKSGSFESAKQRVGLLEQLDYWDDELSTQARVAIDANKQISDAWNVARRVKNLIDERSSYD